MGDMGDMYRDWDVMKKEKKRTNREWIINLLIKNNISYMSQNMGSHLIVFINDERIDIWPATNKAKYELRYERNAYQFLLKKIMKSKDAAKDN